jgi:hypothetical protein
MSQENVELVRRLLVSPNPLVAAVDPLEVSEADAGPDIPRIPFDVGVVTSVASAPQRSQSGAIKELAAAKDAPALGVVDPAAHAIDLSLALAGVLAATSLVRRRSTTGVFETEASRHSHP